MSARIGLQQRIDDYLAERRRLGFDLRSRDTLLAGFVRYVADRHHRGPLTADLMVDWARQDRWQRDTPSTWAARLAKVRHFARYLKQFEPDTEVPEEAVFGPEPGRVAPHIFHEEEIVQLLAAARRLGPQGSIRPATYEALFGLLRLGRVLSLCFVTNREVIDPDFMSRAMRCIRIAKSPPGLVHQDNEPLGVE